MKTDHPIFKKKKNSARSDQTMSTPTHGTLLRRQLNLSSFARLGGYQAFTLTKGSSLAEKESYCKQHVPQECGFHHHMSRKTMEHWPGRYFIHHKPPISWHQGSLNFGRLPESGSKMRLRMAVSFVASTIDVRGERGTAKSHS